MKFFAVASAVAAVAAAEADPQYLVHNTPVVHHTPAVVHSSPLLKTIVPAATQTVTYAKPVAASVPIASTYVAHQPAVVHTTSYAKPVEYKTITYAKPEVEVKKVEYDEEKKVVAYAHQPVAYNQPIAYTYPTAYAQPQYVAQQPLTYVAAQPAQKVYHAKSAEGVEHTVISKREAEAEPIDYVSVQTGPLSSVKYPTIQKTLSAYNKYPYAAGYAYAAPVAPAVAAPVAVNSYATPYAYGYPTYPTYHY